MLLLMAACGDADTEPCQGEAALRTTTEGVAYVRTPDSCFEDLPDWPYAPRYVDLDGLRQAYVDEGPSSGPVVLLLHGQPSWSYLYRKMIPVLADAGMRVIAMDHLGMGRSDKPTDLAYYTYLRHAERLERFIEALDLRDITLFVQDWGSLVGLRVAAENPERFARLAVGNGDLPAVAADTEITIPEEPDAPDSIPSIFAGTPDQQEPYYDGCELLGGDGGVPGGFLTWVEYALWAESFRASEVLEANTWFDLPAAEEAAYDAPFPTRTYMAGPRTFPSLIAGLPGVNDEARAALLDFPRPFLTLWGSNDPGNLGRCETQDALICEVPGAEGQAHARLPEAGHFLQDDQGPEIATRLVEFVEGDTSRGADYTATCAAPPDDGTGTPCTTDEECSGLEASTCIAAMGMGFCTREGCVAGGCSGGFLCCSECMAMVEEQLGFTGSACFPEMLAERISAGCRCE